MHLDDLPERNGEAMSYVHLLNDHLKHSHVREFASACGLTVRPEEFLDYYEEACKEKGPRKDTRHWRKSGPSHLGAYAGSIR